MPINNLQELDLSRNKIDNIESLSNIYYSNLITLNLSNNNIYDISSLINASFKKLKNFILTYSKWLYSSLCPKLDFII